MARRTTPQPAAETNSAVVGVMPTVAQTSCATARAQVAETEALIATAKEREHAATLERDAAIDDAALYAHAERARLDASIEVQRLTTLLERHQTTLHDATTEAERVELETLTESTREQLVAIKIAGEEAGRRAIAMRVAKESLERTAASFNTTRNRILELAKKLGVAAPDLPRVSGLSLGYAYEQSLLFSQPSPDVTLTKDWFAPPKAEDLLQTLREAHGVLAHVPGRWDYPVDQQLADLIADPERYKARCREAAVAEQAVIEAGRAGHEKTEKAIRQAALRLEIAERLGASAGDLLQLRRELDEARAPAEASA